MQLIWPGPGADRDAARDQLIEHLKELPSDWRVSYKPVDHDGRDASYGWAWPAADDLFAHQEAAQEAAREVKAETPSQGSASAIVVLSGRVHVSDVIEEKNENEVEVIEVQPAPVRRNRYSADCAEIIRGIIDDVGERMTQTQILDRMCLAGNLFSVSTLAHTLAEMVRRRELTNAKDCHGAGYGPPSWLEADEAEDQTTTNTPDTPKEERREPGL